VILARYLTRLYLGWFFAVLAALLVVYVVADFGDRLKAFLDRPIADVALLYWNKVLVAVQQLGPAAMLLAGGAAASTLRKRGEWVAVQSVGGSAATVFAPIAVCVLAIAAGLGAWDEWIAAEAGQQIDQLHLQKFQTFGDMRFFYTPRQWYRVGDTLVQLRGGERDGAERDVTLYELSPEFHLRERIDANELRPLGGEQWELRGVVARTFDGERSERRLEARREVRLAGTRPDAFRIRTGRPEQMRLSDLIEQQQRREAVGLPIARYGLALHQRFAYPLTGAAATLLAVAIALRRNRRGHLTLALVEGLAVAVALWGTLVVFKSLALAEHVAPVVAAWTPAVAMLAATLALAGREGWLKPAR
jgi:lipopolysaccharide export system permease protein